MQCKSTPSLYNKTSINLSSLLSSFQKMKKFNFIRDGETKLPPGFRFQPTDQEIVFDYLARKIFSHPLPASVIPEIPGLHLWNLPGDSEREKYMFADREVINVRSCRGSGCAGFWKATGSDKRIVCSKRSPIVGVRRRLVFYEGKHPYAVRTDWFMHVYCIAVSSSFVVHHKRHSHQGGGMIQIGEWVLCHVFPKRRSKEDDRHLVSTDTDPCSSDSDCSSSVVSEVSSSSD